MNIPARGDEENSVRVRVEAATDIGLKRSRNEDQYGIWVPEDPEQRRRHGLLLAIADGMGGARGGEVASRLAIETVLRTYREAPGESLADDLRAAVLAANRRIHRESLTNPDLGGMGTTCTAVVLRQGEILLAHVGDSRAYLVRAEAEPDAEAAAVEAAPEAAAPAHPLEWPESDDRAPREAWSERPVPAPRAGPL